MASHRKARIIKQGTVAEIQVPPLVFLQAWGELEKAEHEREAALRAELIRQEKLELLAQRFDHKVAMRESWLNENQRLVSQVHGWAWPG